MRRVQVQALALDALHQVLDNKVFRILGALALLPALFTLLVAFRQEELVVLFGWKRWPYSDLGMTAGVDDPRSLLIEQFLSLVFEQAAGPLGVLVCLVATAFFVPQMIEKGAADVLFHKPLARLTLYLSRYLAGLLFVALLAALMALGVYAGLALVSGHEDRGILAAAFSLTYVFALLYPVSMFFGVLTKSPIAAVLCTLIFMFVNGCIVHPVWTYKEFWRDSQHTLLAEETGDGPAVSEPLDTLDPALRVAATASDVLHWTLPKTGDGKLIARELRRAASAAPYADADSGVSFHRLPAGAQRSAARDLELPAGVASFLGPARFALDFPAEQAFLSLHRRERSQQGTEGGESSRDVAKQLELLLSDARPERTSGTVGGRGPTLANIVRWEHAGQSSSASLFRAGDWIYTLLVQVPADLDETRRDELRARIDDSFGLETTGDGGGFAFGPWYERQAGFDAPWRFNLALSIATSLAFVALVLGLGWWRLARMDF